MIGYCKNSSVCFNRNVQTKRCRAAARTVAPPTGLIPLKVLKAGSLASLIGHQSIRSCVFSALVACSTCLQVHCLPPFQPNCVGSGVMRVLLTYNLGESTSRRGDFTGFLPTNVPLLAENAPVASRMRIIKCRV